MSTVASVVNLVRSQVYRTERPPLFAAFFAVMQRVAGVRQQTADTSLSNATIFTA